jgi:short-subunit dehydrogenase
MTRQLRGRNVILTGASRGIGRCLAVQAAAAGARLALTARSQDELAKLADELKATGAEVWPIAADLTDKADRERLVEEAAAALGGVDLLINNAGLASFGDFVSSDEDVLRRIMEINFFAPAELTRLCLPHLQKGQQPAVVMVGSVCGRRGIPTWPEHSASKFALTGLTEALRAEFQRFGIDVLLVLPGLTRADDLEKHLLRNEGQLKLDFAGAQSPERVAQLALRAIEKNRSETVIGFVAWWVVFGQMMGPWFMNWLLAAKMRGACR